MMLLETIKLALQSIRRNPLRSFLTVLGVVIGVGAVIAMVTIGNGTTARVTADLAKLGSNLLFVAPGQFGPGRASSDARPFNARDIEAMRSQLGGVRAIAPVAQKSVRVVRGSESRNTVVTGTDNDYFVTQGWNLTAGRVFLAGELRAGRAACIVGETVRKELFGHRDPIGQSLRISCEVIGLLEAKGQSSFGTDQDDIVIVPLRAFQRRIAGNTDVARIYVSPPRRSTAPSRRPGSTRATPAARASPTASPSTRSSSSGAISPATTEWRSFTSAPAGSTAPACRAPACPRS
jgi:putative ABC transport system permease protein